MLWLVILWFVFEGLVWAQDGLFVDGWARAGGGVVAMVNTNGQFSNWSYIGQTLWRVSLENQNSDYGRFDFSIDISMLSGAVSNTVNTPLHWYVGDEALFVFDIRKFQVTVKPFWGDVIIGRQLVRWGEGVIFSPMDFFSQLDMRDVSLSRVGIDALRVKIPIGQVGFAESIGIIKSAWTNSTAGFRVGGNIASWYGTGALFYRGLEREWIGGVSFKGDIGLTYYGEVIYRYTTTNTNTSFWHGMVGVDYSLEKKWIFRLEYMTHTLERTNFSVFEQYRLPLYPFLSRHYASFQVIWVPTLLDSFSLMMIANLDDPKTVPWQKGQLWILTYTRNLYQNVNLFSWLRYQTDMSAITEERQGFISAMISLEVKY